MAPWDEERGRVTRAFNDWILVDKDQRAFLRLGLEFAAREYGRLWTETEEAREEVLIHQGRPIPVEVESPRWGPQKRFFDQLGVKIETDEVKEVRDLRNFLTHRRGELRTEEQREQYRSAHPDEFPPLALELSKEDVLAAMNTLAAAVRQIDSTVYDYSWGRRAHPNLKP